MGVGAFVRVREELGRTSRYLALSKRRTELPFTMMGNTGGRQGVKRSRKAKFEMHNRYPRGNVS